MMKKRIWGHRGDVSLQNAQNSSSLSSSLFSRGGLNGLPPTPQLSLRALGRRPLPPASLPCLPACRPPRLCWFPGRLTLQSPHPSLQAGRENLWQECRGCGTPSCSLQPPALVGTHTYSIPMLPVTETCPLRGNLSSAWVCRHSGSLDPDHLVQMLAPSLTAESPVRSGDVPASPGGPQDGPISRGDGGCFHAGSNRAHTSHGRLSWPSSLFLRGRQGQPSQGRDGGSKKRPAAQSHITYGRHIRIGVGPRELTLKARPA